MKTGSKILTAKGVVALILCMATAAVSADGGNVRSGAALASVGSARPIVAAFYYPWYGNPTFDGQ